MLRHNNPQIQEILARIDRADHAEQPDVLLPAVLELQQLSAQLDDAGGIACTYYYFSAHQLLLHNQQEALHYAQKGVTFAHEQGLDYYEIYTRNLCGIICEGLSDYASSLDHYLTAFSLAKRIGDDSACYMLVNIGNLFMVLDDFDTALVYLTGGFEAMLQAGGTAPDDRANLATTVLNIIEACVAGGKLVNATKWATRQNDLLAECGKAGIARCFLRIGESHVALHSADFAKAAQVLLPLLNDIVSPENFSEYYTLNVLLHALNIAIDINNEPLARRALNTLDRTRAASAINTFDYKLEWARIRYFDRFLADDPDYLKAKAYFYPFYQNSLSTVGQLSHTYATSLNMRTELDRAETERRTAVELNAELRHLVDLDPLTGVCNKLGARTHTVARLAARQPGQCSALLLIDIDHFKLVNDTYGHPVGDRVLESFSALLEQLFPSDDVVGRIGGDEFMVFLTHGGNLQAHLDRAEALLRGARELRFDGAPECRVTLSIGLCPVTGPESYDELVDKADRALYAAKQAGRDRCVPAD